MTHILRRFMLSISMLVIAVLALTGVAEACGAWSLIASPNPSANGNYLQAVAAISTNNVYAVGYYYKGTSKSNQVKQILIERFNGTHWSIIASPNVGTGESILNGVARVPGTNQLYAVGSSNGSLILHFNGSSWSMVNLPTSCGPLTAVSADSATDVWAVGGVSDFNSKTCVEHFNGTRWIVVASPSPGTSDDTLLGVTALSPSNVWAVGSYCIGVVCDRGGGLFQTLIAHFNGTSWSVVASPNPSSSFNTLNAIAAVSASSIYAVGNYSPSFGTNHTLIERFNGSAWSVVSSPTVKGSTSLNGIAVVSANNIYAVGAASIPTAPAHPTLILHFNGSTWSIVSNPSPGIHNALSGVAHVPGTSQLYAVGNYDNNGPALTLTEYYC